MRYILRYSFGFTQILRGDGSGPFQGRAFIGCDNHPVTFQVRREGGVPSSAATTTQSHSRWVFCVIGACCRSRQGITPWGNLPSLPAEPAVQANVLTRSQPNCNCRHFSKQPRYEHCPGCGNPTITTVLTFSSAVLTCCPHELTAGYDLCLHEVGRTQPTRPGSLDPTRVTVEQGQAGIQQRHEAGAGREVAPQVRQL